MKRISTFLFTVNNLDNESDSLFQLEELLDDGFNENQEIFNFFKSVNFKVRDKVLENILAYSRSQIV